MKNDISYIIDEFREKFAMANVNSFFKKDNEQYNYNVNLYTVVLSWLCDLGTLDEFNYKYFKFSTMFKLIEKDKLFENANKINDESDKELIKFCLNTYQSIINNPYYEELVSTGGLSLHDSFGVYENYLNDSLKQKVNFLYDLKNELDEVSKEIETNFSKKGVDRK